MKKIILLMFMLILIPLTSCFNVKLGSKNIDSIVFQENNYEEFRYFSTSFLDEGKKVIEEGMATYCYRFYEMNKPVRSILKNMPSRQVDSKVVSTFSFIYRSFAMNKEEVGNYMAFKSNQVLDKYDVKAPEKDSYLHHFTVSNTTHGTENYDGIMNETRTIKYENYHDDPLLVSVNLVCSFRCYLVETYVINDINELEFTGLSFAYKQFTTPEISILEQDLNGRYLSENIM